MLRGPKLAQWRMGRNTGTQSTSNIRHLKPNGGSMVQGAEQPGGEHHERKDTNNEEARRLRRLQVMMSMVMSVISQDPDLTLEEAAEMAANARRAALSMFPDKELAYDLIYRPRLQRLMNERFRLQ